MNEPMDEKTLNGFYNLVSAISEELCTRSIPAIERFGHVCAASGMIDAAGATLIAGGYSRADVAEWLVTQGHKMMRVESDKK